MFEKALQYAEEDVQNKQLSGRVNYAQAIKDQGSQVRGGVTSPAENQRAGGRKCFTYKRTNHVAQECFQKKREEMQRGKQSSLPNSKGRQGGNVAVLRQQGTSVEVIGNSEARGKDYLLAQDEIRNKNSWHKGLTPGRVSCETTVAASDVNNRAHVVTGIGVGDFNVTNCSGRGHLNSTTWDAILAELQVLMGNLEQLAVIRISSVNDGHPRHRNRVVLPSCLPAKTLTGESARSDSLEDMFLGKYLNKSLNSEIGQNSYDRKLSYIDFVPDNDSEIDLTNIFLKKDQKLGCTDRISHSIKTGDAKPFSVRPYRVPQSQKETLPEKIQIMLDAQVIVPSSSLW
ncbi:hypothetical protein PR048_005966 [Dryococelus australis]|uniref:Uncharacterized protein n=1 Tax=Dryococelus australis TaxID=614101 RepID=A0ABQ9I9M9_9NEOP|nr:hypothetical protein PR048_005966 [Dryococelus australis]